MNTPNDELDLRRRLRQLPSEREPTRDLWIGIESRLGDISMSTRAPRTRARAWAGWAWTGLAAVASLVLAIGVALRPASITAPAPTTSQTYSNQATSNQATSKRARGANETVRREAEAITLEYRLALEPFAAAELPHELQGAAVELDASAQQLRRALREQPDALYLLDRLRRTYDQRLKLSQRAMLS